MNFEVPDEAERAVRRLAYRLAMSESEVVSRLVLTYLAANWPGPKADEAEVFRRAAALYRRP